MIRANIVVAFAAVLALAQSANALDSGFNCKTGIDENSGDVVASYLLALDNNNDQHQETVLDRSNRIWSVCDLNALPGMGFVVCKIGQMPADGPQTLDRLDVATFMMFDSSTSFFDIRTQSYQSLASDQHPSYQPFIYCKRGG
jgi:hypothetical protein